MMGRTMIAMMGNDWNDGVSVVWDVGVGESILAPHFPVPSP